jgi:hypothetical protein
VNPVIVAEPTVIVQVALDTTSPAAALAFFGVVADGDDDGPPAGEVPLADGAVLAEAAAPGALVGPAVGSGAAVPDGPAAGADDEGAAGEVVAGELGPGLGLLGKQKTSRMHV